MELLKQIGLQEGILLTIAIVWLIDKVISVLKGRGIDLNKMANICNQIEQADVPQISRRVAKLDKELPTIMSQLKDLHDWHNVSDEEGVKIWYVRRSLEKAISDLSNNLAAQTEVLKALHTEQVQNMQQNKLIVTELKEISKRQIVEAVKQEAREG